MGPAVRLDAAINSNQGERGPFISATGLEFFFQRGSTAGVNSTLDIWVARRSSLDDSWNSPVPVAEVNSIYGDGWPVLSSNGLSLYFTSYPPGVSATVGRTYVATRPTVADPFGAPQPLFAGSLNHISANELTAFIDFESLTGMGGVDMWMVTRASINDSFGAPVNLGSPLNAKLDDFGARIAPDGIASEVEDVFIAPQPQPIEQFGPEHELASQCAV